MAEPQWAENFEINFAAIMPRGQFFPQLDYSPQKNDQNERKKKNGLSSEDDSNNISRRIQK
jgi:hypothetical protein